MPEQTSEELSGRDLDVSVARALGWSVLPYSHMIQHLGGTEEYVTRFRLLTPEGATWACPFLTEEAAWEGVPHWQADGGKFVVMAEDVLIARGWQFSFRPRLGGGNVCTLLTPGHAITGEGENMRESFCRAFLAAVEAEKGQAK